MQGGLQLSTWVAWDDSGYRISSFSVLPESGSLVGLITPTLKSSPSDLDGAELACPLSSQGGIYCLFRHHTERALFSLVEPRVRCMKAGTLVGTPPRVGFAAQGKGLLISSLFLLPSEWGWVEGQKTHDLCPTPAHAGWFSPLLVPAWILR